MKFHPCQPEVLLLLSALAVHVIVLSNHAVRTVSGKVFGIDWLE